MSTVNRIVKNIGSLYVANILHKVLTLVLFVFIARYLGDEGLGQYSFIIAFVALFNIIPTFGLDSVIIRDVARDRGLASRYISNASLLRTGLYILIFPPLVLSLSYLGYPSEIRTLVYIYLLSAFFTGISLVFRSTFLAHEKMEYEAAIIILNRVTVVPLSVAALILGYGLKGLIVVLAVAGFANFAFSFLILKRMVSLKFQPDLGLTRTLLKLALPFVLLGAFNVLYANIDIVMLSTMMGDRVTGWYNAAFRLLNALLFIPVVFTGSIFPTMCRYFTSSRDSLSFAYRKTFQYLSIIAIPLAVGSFFLADKIILKIYGSEFLNSIAALQILSWGIILKFLNNLLLTTLVSMNMEKTNAKIVAFGVSLNVLLNFILIPRYSYIGASVATIAAEVAFFVLAYYAISRRLGTLPILRIVSKPLVSSLVMAGALYTLKDVASLFLLIPLGAVLYFGTLFLIRGFTKEDFDLFKKAARMP